MSSRAPSTTANRTTEVSSMSAEQLRGVVQQQDEKIQALTQQVEWFKRQIFGRKSERFIAEEDPSQLHLGGVLTGVNATSEPSRQAVAGHTRRAPQSDATQAE